MLLEISATMASKVPEFVPCALPPDRPATAIPAETKLAMFRTAMQLAKRNEEEALALDILSECPPGDASLRL